MENGEFLTRKLKIVSIFLVMSLEIDPYFGTRQLKSFHWKHDFSKVKTCLFVALHLQQSDPIPRDRE
jgi:hypothetical protein